MKIFIIIILNCSSHAVRALSNFLLNYKRIHEYILSQKTRNKKNTNDFNFSFNFIYFLLISYLYNE